MGRSVGMRASQAGAGGPSRDLKVAASLAGRLGAHPRQLQDGSFRDDDMIDVSRGEGRLQYTMDVRVRSHENASWDRDRDMMSRDCLPVRFVKRAHVDTNSQTHRLRCRTSTPPSAGRNFGEVRLHHRREEFTGSSIRSHSLRSPPWSLGCSVLSSRYTVRPSVVPAPTTVALRLDHETPVELHVHEVTGKRIRTLASGIFQSGEHHIVWKGLECIRRIKLALTK